MGLQSFQPKPPFQQQQQPHPPPPQNTQENKPPLDDLLMQFMSKMEAKDAKVDQAIQAQQATIQNLERQIGQLAKAV